MDFFVKSVTDATQQLWPTPYSYTITPRVAGSIQRATHMDNHSSIFRLAHLRACSPPRNTEQKKVRRHCCTNAD